MKTKTQAAQAAAMIKKHLKKHGIPCTVKSSNYAGGSSLTVTVNDLMPAARIQIESYVNQFQYGKFDGMTDCYDVTNRRDDLPQVSYAFLRVEYSDEMQQAAWDHAKKTLSGMDGAPESFKDAGKFINENFGEYGQTLIWRFLSGFYDDFWRTRKPRITAPAVTAETVTPAPAPAPTKKPRLKVADIRAAIDTADYRLSDLSGHTQFEYLNADVPASLNPSIDELSIMLESAPERFHADIQKLIERLTAKIEHWKAKKSENSDLEVGRGDAVSYLMKNGVENPREILESIQPSNVREYRPDAMTTININTGEQTYSSGGRVIDIKSYRISDLQKLH